MLSPIKTKLGNHRVILFVKERKLSSYTRKYKKYAHVEVRAASGDGDRGRAPQTYIMRSLSIRRPQVRAASADFAEYLASSRGLIASPSRGVVTQAPSTRVLLLCAPCVSTWRTRWLESLLSST